MRGHCAGIEQRSSRETELVLLSDVPMRLNAADSYRAEISAVLNHHWIEKAYCVFSPQNYRDESGFYNLMSQNRTNVLQLSWVSRAFRTNTPRKLINSGRG